MRIATVSMIALTLCVAACGKAAKPEPEPTETASAAVAVPAPVHRPTGAAVAESPAPAAPAASAAPSVVPAKLSALGTEPFWNARIDGTALTYSTPEGQAGKRIAVTRRDTAIGAVFSGTLDGAPLILTVSQHTCSDGMSDRAYPLRTVLTIGTQRSVGCAS